MRTPKTPLINRKQTTSQLRDSAIIACTFLRNGARGWDGAAEFKKRQAYVGLILLAVIAIATTYHVPWVKSLTTIITETDWRNNYSDIDYGRMLVDPATGKLKLNVTPGSKTHDKDADFTGSGYDTQSNSTRIIGDSVQLGREGDVQGLLTLDDNAKSQSPSPGDTRIGNLSPFKSGNLSALIKDPDNGLHVLYQDAVNNKLAYKHSTDYGALWSAPTLIPIATSEYPTGPSYAPTSVAHDIDAAIDRPNGILWVAFRMEKRSKFSGTNTLNDYSAVMLASCKYISAINNSGCELSANWTVKLFDSYSTASFTSMDTFGRSPSVAVSNSFESDKKVLHIAYTRNNGYKYRNCSYNAEATCQSKDTGESALDTSSRWPVSYTDNTGDYSNPDIAAIDTVAAIRLYYYHQSSIWRRLRYRECALFLNSSDCTWSSVIDATADSFTASPTTPADHVEASYSPAASPQLGVVFTQTNAALTLVFYTGSVGQSSVVSYTIAVASSYRVPAVSLDENGVPSIIFTKDNSGDKVYYAKHLDTVESTCGLSNTWHCSPVEAGGVGDSTAVISSDILSVTHIDPTRGLRFIATPFKPMGTYTSPVVDATAEANWISLRVKGTMPKDQSGAMVGSFSLRVRSSSQAASITDPNSYCEFPLNLGVTTPGPFDITISDMRSALNQNCASKLSNGRQYFQYQIAFTGNRLSSPVIDYLNVDYMVFPLEAWIISKPLLMNGTEPVIKSISWKEAIPNSSATVKLQIAVSTTTDFSTATWYGAMNSPTRTFDSAYADSAVSGDCPRTIVNSGVSPPIKLVTCPIDPSHPIRSIPAQYVEYKVILGSPLKDDTATISEVAITYATNQTPSVSVGQSVVQSETGGITVTYTISDLDSSAFDVALFYDAGLKLSQPLGSNDGIVNLNSGGMPLSALLPNPGTILIDKEQITYYSVGGSYVSLTTRGVYNTANDIHSQNATVWVRATDAKQRDDFGRPQAYATGDIGANQPKGVPRTITWQAGADIDGSLYRPASGGNKILVLANDGEEVKQVGVGLSNDFTLDTKPPQMGANALDITGVNVITVAGGLKTNSSTVTLNITAPGTTNDNTSGNQMSFCNGNCAQPTAAALIARTAPGWSALESFSTFKLNYSLNTAQQCSSQTINVVVLDPSGNISMRSRPIVYDATSPPVPNNFSIDDISGATVGSMLYLRWEDISGSPQLQCNGGSDFAKFKIYRSTGTNQPAEPPYQELTTSASATSLVDTSVSVGVQYNYKIVVEDNTGNQSSTLSAAPSVSATPSTAGLPPAPVVSNARVDSASITTTSATVKWDTDIPSDSRVVYASVSSQPQSFAGYPSQGTTALATSGTDGHTVTLVGLEPSTPYFIEARSSAPGNNTAGTKNTDNSGAALQFKTLTPPPTVTPQISNVNVNYTHTTATFAWTTDIAADSFVEYGTDSSLGATAAYYGQRDSTQNHNVSISSLTPLTTYYYRVHSTAGEGTGTYPAVGSSALSFTTNVDPQDTIPPQYSNIQVTSVQYNTATITWTTNEPATEFVEFWKDGEVATRLWPLAPGQLRTGHSVQLPFDLQPNTDYKFKVWSADSSNNSVPSAEQPPFHTSVDPGDTTPPAFTSAVPIRNDPATATTVTIYFTTDEPSDATVFYSLGDQSYGEAQYFPMLSRDHAITLVNLTPGQLYYYKVRTTNSSGLYTEGSDCGSGPQSCFFTTLPQANPLPLIVNGSITVSNIETNRATVSWKTTEPGDSFVEFGTATVEQNGVEVPIYGRTFGDIRKTSTDHTVILPNDLQTGQTYYFRVRTRDVFDQLVVYPGTPDPNDSTCANDPFNCLNPAFTTLVSNQVTINELDAPPIITGVGALLVTDVKAVVGWSTDKLATSEVDFGVSNTYGAAGTPIIPKDANGNLIYTRTHAVTLEGLQPQTTYYFKVSSISLLPADLRATDDNGGQGYSFTTNAGTGAGQASQQGQQGVVKTDFAPPMISQIEVSNITETEATVTWNTDEQGTSIVEFGETDTYGQLSGDATTLTTSHTVKLKKLDPGTEYHYLVVSLDKEGNRGQSSDATFKTKGVKGEKPTEEEKEPGEAKKEEGQKDKKGKDELDEATKRIAELGQEKKLSVEKILKLLEDFSEKDVADLLGALGIQLVSPPKFVGGLPRVAVTTTTATISWETDKQSDSRVAYAIESGYNAGKDDPYLTETGDSQTYEINHEVVITGLEPNTVYHYQVRSRERAGRTGRSVDRVFRTLPLQPEISGIGIRGAAERSVILVWKTNVPTKTVVDYTNVATNSRRSQGDPQFVTAHEFTLRDLEPSTSYKAIINVSDETGLSAASSPLAFATIKDEVAPEINQVRTDVTILPGKSEYSQAIVTWRTNEPSTSQVFYEEGITQSAELKNSTPENTDYLVNHVVILNKLRPAMVYRFRATSADASGNRATSRDFTLLTPQKQESVLEIIIKNFEETFGFLKTIGQ